MARHVQQLLAIGGIGGAHETLEALFDELTDTPIDAVAVTGDLGAPWSKADTYRALLKRLGQSELPAFWVPGPTDAPIRDYLRESYNIEIAYPNLRGVHGSAAIGPDNVLFAGMGGEILDDPDSIRAEEAILRYPGWEVEYRLKIVREFKDYMKVFLFATRPAHKGLHEAGSEVLAELIKTYRPRIAIAGDGDAGDERLGTTLVVYPGRLDQGSYALVRFQELSVEIGTVAERAAV